MRTENAGDVGVRHLCEEEKELVGDDPGADEALAGGEGGRVYQTKILTCRNCFTACGRGMYS